MLLATVAIAFICLQLYTLTLIILRGTLFRVRIYKPMIWNLFLSLVPLLVQLLLVVILLLLTMLIMRMEDASVFIHIFRFIGIAGLVVWALFFPNASYLITELNFSHRKKDDTVPQYYDIIMVFTLASTGFINALASLAFFHFIVLLAQIDPPAGVVPLTSWLIVLGYALASSFAIYLGRHIRVNSWDILHPIAFVRKLWKHFTVREHRRTALGYTVFFTGTLFIAHIMFFSLLYSAIL